MDAARLRVGPVVVFAVGTAAVIAWALRDNARFLPTTVVPLHDLVSGAHTHGEAAGYVPPAPVTGAPLANYPGLVMLAVHLTAIGIVAAAWSIRRSFRRPDRNVHSVPARLLFAALVALAAALVTLPIAAFTLGTAILLSATLAAAMTVLQYTFVLAIVGAAILGVP
jgi:hypothetical protein